MCLWSAIQHWRQTLYMWAATQHWRQTLYMWSATQHWRQTLYMWSAILHWGQTLCLHYSGNKLCVSSLLHMTWAYTGITDSKLTGDKGVIQR